MNTNKTYIYTIIIDGVLDEHWSEWFDGFELTTLNKQTHLRGTVSDQAALFGVLRKVRNLGLVLDSVVRQSADKEEEDKR